MGEDISSEWQRGWARISDAFRRATAPVDPDADVRHSEQALGTSRSWQAAAVFDEDKTGSERGNRSCMRTVTGRRVSAGPGSAA